MALKRFTNGDKLKADQINYDKNTSILDAIFPIGRGFIDFTNTDYSNYLGFKWERELVGMTAVGYKSGDSDFGTIGKTGGEKTHKHGYGDYYATIRAQGNTLFHKDKSQTWTHTGAMTVNSNTEDNGSTDYAVGVEGVSADESSLQPYKVVAYWKRIA